MKSLQVLERTTFTASSTESTIITTSLYCHHVRDHLAEHFCKSDRHIRRAVTVFAGSCELKGQLDSDRICELSIDCSRFFKSGKSESRKKRLLDALTHYDSCSITLDDEGLLRISLLGWVRGDTTDLCIERAGKEMSGNCDLSVGSNLMGSKLRKTICFICQVCSAPVVERSQWISGRPESDEEENSTVLLRFPQKPASPPKPPKEHFYIGTNDSVLSEKIGEISMFPTPPPECVPPRGSALEVFRLLLNVKKPEKVSRSLWGLHSQGQLREPWKLVGPYLLRWLGTKSDGWGEVRFASAVLIAEIVLGNQEDRQVLNSLLGDSSKFLIILLSVAVAELSLKSPSPHVKKILSAGELVLGLGISMFPSDTVYDLITGLCRGVTRLAEMPILRIACRLICQTRLIDQKIVSSLQILFDGFRYLLIRGLLGREEIEGLCLLLKDRGRKNLTDHWGHWLSGGFSAEQIHSSNERNVLIDEILKNSMFSDILLFVFSAKIPGSEILAEFLTNLDDKYIIQIELHWGISIRQGIRGVDSSKLKPLGNRLAGDAFDRNKASSHS